MNSKELGDTRWNKRFLTSDPLKYRLPGVQKQIKKKNPIIQG